MRHGLLVACVVCERGLLGQERLSVHLAWSPRPKVTISRTDFNDVHGL